MFFIPLCLFPGGGGMNFNQLVAAAAAAAGNNPGECGGRLVLDGLLGLSVGIGLCWDTFMYVPNCFGAVAKLSN